ncbi:hypothetical protein GCM10023189_45610 [Nibrella saemangeumensis]|uniref:Uncharacterized protein n=2 Tax=Nibrella saemangeumensis TaxID=1084526 RepID=A0ABP8NG63_9BACT
MLLCLMALLVSISSNAQSDLYAQHPTVSDKGHWKLFTDNQNRNTVIKFFNVENQLVYEEVMAGKYIKLTDQNVQLINEIFDRVMANKLIAGTVKSAPLEEVAISNRTAVWTGPALKPESVAEVAVHNQLNYNIRLNSHVTEYESRRLLRVQVENPEQYRLIVKLQDKNGQNIYWEPLTKKASLVKLNLSELRSRSYTLEVSTPNRKYSYIRHIAL